VCCGPSYHNGYYYYSPYSYWSPTDVFFLYVDYGVGLEMLFLFSFLSMFLSFEKVVPLSFDRTVVFCFFFPFSFLFLSHSHELGGGS
jgi:hypothetical protein